MRRVALFFVLCAVALGGLGAMLVGGGTASAAHPIDALLRGSFTMKGTITVADYVYGEHTGQHVTRTWRFYPSCSSAGCKRVLLKRLRSPRHVLDAIELYRKSAGVYVGKHRFWLALSCDGVVNKRGGYGYETITVTILRASVTGGTRRATRIRASYVNSARYNETHCPGGIGHDAARYSGRLNTT